MGLPHPGKQGRGAAWWRRLLGEFTRSAETLSAFAAARGVARSSLHLWGRRLGIVTDRRGGLRVPETLTAQIPEILAVSVHNVQGTIPPRDPGHRRPIPLGEKDVRPHDAPRYSSAPRRGPDRRPGR